MKVNITAIIALLSLVIQVLPEVYAILADCEDDDDESETD